MDMERTVKLSSKPVRTGKLPIPDGAIAGNGDLSVILGNSENGMRVHIGKCDMWMAVEEQHRGGIQPVGWIDIDIGKSLYDNYYVEQRMDKGELYCRFTEGSSKTEFKITVCASNNLIIIENLTQRPITPVLHPDKSYSRIESISAEGYSGFVKSFVDDALVFDTSCAALTKTVGNCFCVYVCTNHDSPDFRQTAADFITALTPERIKEEYAEHRSYWESFWSKSSMVLSDKELELNWCAGQYYMAVCSRNEGFPPGLFGNYIAIPDISWKGDYHLNYNYEAAFYHVCSSNHVELTDCYHSPLTDFIERGREYSQKHLGTKGVYLPVSLGPKGMITELMITDDVKRMYDRMDMGQRMNAAFGAVILIYRWYSTLDKEYAKEIIYPFIKGVAEFWESYLVKENGRYNVIRDSVYEVAYYRADFKYKDYKRQINQRNGNLTLGLLKLLFQCLIDMSAALDCDSEEREVWRDIEKNLAPYPILNIFGWKLFLSSEGQLEIAGIDGGNSGGHLAMPACQIAIGSDEESLKIIRNTFNFKKRWFDDNPTNSVFPAAARIGIKPETIIRKLKINYKRFRLPNLLYNRCGGCLENVGLTSSTLNEMALQSFKGVIRIFPNWCSGIDCKYTDLRCFGAFLVSSEINGGIIGETRIKCEKGGRLTVKNPYEKCRVTCGDRSFVTSDEFIGMDTAENDIVVLKNADSV